MSIIEIIKKQNEELLLKISSLLKIIEEKDRIIGYLQQELHLLKHRHFGKKSEKTNSGQLELDFFFDEAQTPDNVGEIEEADEEIVIASHKRKKSGRKPIPPNFTRVPVIHDLLPEEKICSCGCELTHIGQEVSEQFEYVPAKFQVLENIKYKYACKNCEGCIKTANAPVQPIPNSIAAPGLLAHIATAKFCDHLPFYRQERIFQRLGVDIARNTLAHWMIKISTALEPLYKCLQHEINAYDIAYADETRVQVLKEPARPATAQSFMWCVIGGSPKKRSVVYHYDPHRSTAVLSDLLPDLSGYLHCDGYSAYDAYSACRPVKQAGCWMHVRRKFIDVTKVVKTSGLAHQVVRLIKNLYLIEAKIKSERLEAPAIQAFRQKHSKPVLDKIQALVQDNLQNVLPQSSLGKALFYTQNQWEKLQIFLQDGRLEIDNGLTERAIKPFVIGRKNFLFFDSVSGAKAGQILYSLIETCKLHGREPYAYLKQVLTQLPGMNTLDAIETLLPFNIQLE